jgi:outer membrane protein assembly factor BamB
MRFYLGILLVAFLSDGGRAQDHWPQFRGPQSNGHAAATGLPTSWSNTENVAWKTPVPGEGWSSPVVGQNRVYLTAAVKPSSDDISLRLYWLDARSGEIEGYTEVFRVDADSAPRIHQKNSHASPTPILDGGQVFVHFGHHGTACLSDDGQIQWRTQELAYDPVHGNGGSPVLVDGLLIYSADGAENPFVAALDRATGAVVWKSPRSVKSAKTFSFSTPAVIEIDGRRQVVSPGSGGVSVHDPRSGRRLWQVQYDGYSVIPQPVYHQGLLFLSTGFDSPEALAIRAQGAAGDNAQQQIVWRSDRSAPLTPSMLVVDGLLYMVSDSGVASCLEAESGKLVWRRRLGGNFSASPVYADGKIYMQNETGTGYVLQPGREFQLVSENELGERTLASYAVAHHGLYIRTAEHLYCIRQTGSDLEGTSAGGGQAQDARPSSSAANTDF